MICAGSSFGLLIQAGPGSCGGIVAIEVKASAAPTPDDARHLATLRDRTGSSFVAGVVFHTGPRAYRLREGIVAAPISALWS